MTTFTITAVAYPVICSHAIPQQHQKNEPNYFHLARSHDGRTPIATRITSSRVVLPNDFLSEGVDQATYAPSSLTIIANISGGDGKV